MPRIHTWLSIVVLFATAACGDQPTPTASDPSSAPIATSNAKWQTGYILRDGRPIRVVFEVRQDRGIFEGDIDLGPASQIARTEAELLGRSPGARGPRYGVVTTSNALRWYNGVVPYVIEPDVPDPSRVTSAVAHIEANVHGVDLVPRTTQADYIIVRRTTDPNICGQSALGHTGGAQILLLHDGCSMGVVVHEIGHALGIWHEQSRCDRDNYVEILYQNVMSGYASQFDKHCTGAADVFGYDEGSIMHYGTTAFGLNGSTTIRSKRGLDYLMGQRNGLSATDANTVDWMYHPYAPTGMSVSYPGNVPTISWSSSSGGPSYTVVLVTRVYISDYERGSSEQDYTTYIGTTNSLSIQDLQGTYTGQDICQYNSMYTSETDTYFYEVWANYPGAASSPATYAAAVATC
jgi:hypothetical protein